MASDDTLREGVQLNLASFLDKLSCHGDIEKQHFYKTKFLERLKTSPIAIDTDKANEQHYEVPTQFFKTVLGPRLKYSSCYWKDGVSTLKQAEEDTLQMYCDMAGVCDGHVVMDLGCGWGSLGLFICQRFPGCRVTCVSNSSTQRSHIMSEALRMGVSDRLECITADANVFSTNKRYDRIMSIEMFEHMKNYDVLFQRVSSWLKPAGQLFVQILCHNRFTYAFDAKPGGDTEWMARNFFSGGTMPSSELFLYFQRDVCLLKQWIWNGKHYSRTLEAWLEIMDANMPKVKEIFNQSYGAEAEKQIFNWRLFFMFCSEVFKYNDGNDWHVALYLFKKNLNSSL